MPTYEYRCAACEHEWEEVQKITDPPTKFCPKCGANLAMRLISRTSFVLKGNCWSKDMYTHQNKKEQEKN